MQHNSIIKARSTFTNKYFLIFSCFENCVAALECAIGVRSFGAHFFIYGTIKRYHSFMKKWTILSVIGISFWCLMGVAFGAAIGTIVFCIFYTMIVCAVTFGPKLYHKRCLELEKQEVEYLKQNDINGKEYIIGGDFKKVILTTTKLYLRTKPLALGDIFDRKDIKDAKIEMKISNRIVHYEDPDGAMKMGAIAGVAIWFGISTIADLNSLGQDVLEEAVTVYIEIEIANAKLKFYVINDETIKNNLSLQRIENAVKFIKDIKGRKRSRKKTVNNNKQIREKSSTTKKLKTVKDNKTVETQKIYYKAFTEANDGNVSSMNLWKLLIFDGKLDYSIDIKGGLEQLNEWSQSENIFVKAGAFSLLGAMFFEGKYGLQQDYEKAFRYECLAEEYANEGVDYIIGWCYLNGKGVEKDIEKAKYYICKSASDDINPAKKIKEEMGW